MESAICRENGALDLLSQPPSISKDLYEEVKNQVIAKVSNHFPNMMLDSVTAISLYENSIEGLERVHRAQHKKDGTPNNNPNNFGNIGEELAVSSYNAKQIRQGSCHRAERTDNLADMKKSGAELPSEVSQYAVKHHKSVDVVYHDQSSGEVVGAPQIKQIQQAGKMAQEKYATVLVPTDTVDSRRDALNKLAEHPNTKEEKKVHAKRIAANLGDAGYDSVWSGMPDKKSHPILHWVVSKNPTLTKVLPKAYFAKTLTEDALRQVGGRLVLESCSIIIGGVLYEIKDAFTQGAMTFKERLARFFNAVFKKIQQSIKDRGLRELCLEAVNVLFALLGKLFRSVKDLFKTFASAIRQIAGKIYDFVTGKIKSYDKLIASILKVVCTTGIAACALAAENYLSAQFPFIPKLVIDILSAATAALAIVFVNRGIDILVATLMDLCAEAKAKGVHRKKIEEYLAEHLPSLLAETDRIVRNANTVLTRREEIHNKAYSFLQDSFCDAPEQFRVALNEHARVAGAGEIPASYLDNLENELMNFSKKSHFKQIKGVRNVFPF